MANRINVPNPPIGEVDVAELERVLGAELPRDYREFLVRYDGGYPEKHDYVLPEAVKQRCPWLGDVVGVQEFFGIRGRSPASVTLPMLMQAEDAYRPPNALPIGIDPGGNEFLLSLEESSRGAIFFLDHDRNWNMLSECVHLASSFDEFFNSLIEYERS
jgi:cell wall assembly regulator SMI1